MNTIYIMIIPTLACLIVFFAIVMNIFQDRKKAKLEEKQYSSARIANVKSLVDHMVDNNTCMDEFTTKLILLGNALKHGKEINEDFFSDTGKRE